VECALSRITCLTTEIVRYIQWMENTAVTGWFINDLSPPHIVPYRLIYLLSPASCACTPFVQNDAPVSFAARPSYLKIGATIAQPQACLQSGRSQSKASPPGRPLRQPGKKRH